MLEKCLTHNKSCGKARELLGYIKERENNSIEASKHYEDAWKFTNNASIGYRLAFNYMKDNRFT